MKKIIAGMLTLLLTLCVWQVPATAADTSHEGTCGGSLTWKFDGEGTLTISGSGEMSDFGWGAAPWASYSGEIKSLVVGDGVKNIGSCAFVNCESLQTAELPEQLTKVGYGAFNNCTALKEIAFPEGLTYIDDDAFNGCSSLTKASFPSSLEHVGDAAFSRCTALADIEFKDASFSIGDAAFSRCESLVSVKLPEGVKSLGYRAFKNCTSLQTIYIPRSVKTIDNESVEDCKALEYIFYGGSESEWPAEWKDARYVGEDFVRATVCYNSTGDHHYSDWRVETEATCTQEGKSVRVCEGCGREETKTEPVDPVNGHRWGEWKVVKEATEEEAGLEERVCANDSSHKETRPVEKLTPAPMVKFTDVGDISRYYYDPVYWAVEKGITNGYGGANLFSPDANCSREQIVTFLWRMMGKPQPKKHASFTDVKPTDWYYDSISWAAENNITVGLNDGTGRFGVGAPCTRAMCVTFFWRAAGQPAPKTHANFTDAEKGRYYYDAVSWAAENGITVGLNDGTGRFGVDNICSRAMIVTFLYRYAQLGK